jgi:hypothetical protein
MMMMMIFKSILRPYFRIAALYYCMNQCTNLAVFKRWVSNDGYATLTVLKNITSMKGTGNVGPCTSSFIHSRDSETTLEKVPRPARLYPKVSRLSR